MIHTAIDQNFPRRFSKKANLPKQCQTERAKQTRTVESLELSFY